MRLVRCLLPWLSAAHGASIVNVSSPVALHGARKVSYAASKADGHLYCLRDGVIDPTTPPIAITRRDALADCAFTPDGREVLAGGNVFAADQVWRVDPATGARSQLGVLGPGNGEVVLPAAGGIVYRFSDLNDSPSLAAKYRCPAIAR